MAQETHIKIALLDDNKAILNSLATLLGSSAGIDVVHRSTDGEQMLSWFKSTPSNQHPDIVVSDINMPGMSGIEFVRRCKAIYPRVKYVMLTSYEDEHHVFEAIRAGANGYLMKDENSRVILDQIRRLFDQGDVPMTPRIARKTLELLSRLERNPTVDQKIDFERFNLSRREVEVLELLVEGMEYKEIATQLNISPHTVRKHISNIYEKLHVSSKAQVIRLVQNKPLDMSTETTNPAVRIVLVDDHKIIVDSLALMISKIPGIQVVSKFTDSRDVADYLRHHEIDLLISDVNMPHIDGIELARSVNHEFPRLPVLMLTVSDDSSTINRAIDAGAKGYLLKKAGKEELTEAIRTVVAGGKYFPVTITGH